MWPHVTPMPRSQAFLDSRFQSLAASITKSYLHVGTWGGGRNGGDWMVWGLFGLSVQASIVVLLFQTRNVCMKCVTLVRDFSPPSSHLIGQSGQRERRSHRSYEEISHLNSLFVCVYCKQSKTGTRRSCMGMRLVTSCDPNVHSHKLYGVYCCVWVKVGVPWYKRNLTIPETPSRPLSPHTSCTCVVQLLWKPGGVEAISHFLKLHQNRTVVMATGSLHV